MHIDLLPYVDELKQKKYASLENIKRFANSHRSVTADVALLPVLDCLKPLVEKATDGEYEELDEEAEAALLHLQDALEILR